MFAVISDIHSNLEALEAVLKNIHSQSIEKIICLGDIVGYGPDPLKCIELVMKHCEVSLKGNHDYAVLTQALGFNSIAKDAINWTRRKIKPGRFSLRRKKLCWQYLESLPQRYNEGIFSFCHASPRDPITEYVEEVDVVDMGFGVSGKIKGIMAAVEGICFIGHTHHSGIISSDYKFHKPDTENISEFYWEIKNRPAIVNAGSVGQPRDNDSCASYVVVDDEKICYKRVAYDVKKTVSKIRKISALDNKLADRLLEGK